MSPDPLDVGAGDVQTAATASHKSLELLWKLTLAVSVCAVIAALHPAHLQLRVIGFEHFLHYYVGFDVWYLNTLRNNLFVGVEAWGVTFCLLGLEVLYFRKRWKKIRVPFAARFSKHSALHGSARWADWEEMKGMAVLPPALADTKPTRSSKRIPRKLRKLGLEDHQGVYVGSYYRGNTQVHLRHNGPEHVLAFAPTRSGKGVGLVLPTLYTWRESALVHDPKGEAWALSAGYRQSIGQRVFNFDPANPNTEEICAFNPLAEIRLGTSSEVGDSQNIATILMDPEGKGLSDHWAKTGFSLLNGLILHCCYVARKEFDRDATFSDVVSFLTTDTDTPMEELPLKVQKEVQEYRDAHRNQPMPPLKLRLLIMREYPHLEDGTPHPIISQEAQTMYIKEDREMSSVASTAISVLGLYRDPAIVANTSRSDWRIADLMSYKDPDNPDAPAPPPATAYLIVRPSDADRLRPLMRLIMTQVVRQLTANMEFQDGRSVASYHHRLLLLLDEFTALKKLEVVETALAFMAGFGIKAYLIVQDIQQLQAVYGKEETVISNCHVRICYAPNKIETAEVISKTAGTRTVVHKGAKSKEDGQAQAIQETSRPLITPEEVMRLKGPAKNNAGDITRPGDLLVFISGFRPIYGTQMLYFLHKEMNARSRMPAPLIDNLREGDRVPEATPSSETLEAVIAELGATPGDFETRLNRDRAEANDVREVFAPLAETPPPTADLLALGDPLPEPIASVHDDDYTRTMTDLFDAVADDDETADEPAEPVLATPHAFSTGREAMLARLSGSHYRLTKIETAMYLPSRPRAAQVSDRDQPPPRPAVVRSPDALDPVAI